MYRKFLTVAAGALMLGLSSMAAEAAGKTIAVIGRRDPAVGHKGFVIPSPYFCLRMAPDGLLRVTGLKMAP
mgnify:CR=1 FL=1